MCVSEPRCRYLFWAYEAFRFFFWPPVFFYYIDRRIIILIKSFSVSFFHLNNCLLHQLDVSTHKGTYVPFIRTVKLPFYIRLHLSQKTKIKHQHKQYLKCPMSSVKALQMKSEKKKIYIKLKTKVGKPSAWKSYNFLCEDFQKLQNMTNMNVRRR